MSTATTIVGYTASGLVLMTFAMADVRRLRVIAILSNIAFIAYGALDWLPPVLGLHLLLLPLNVFRLIELHRCAPHPLRGGTERRDIGAAVSIGPARYPR